MFEDADQERAADATVNAIVQNAGQTCSAGNRALIQRSIYDAFVDALSRRFARLKVGPHDLDLDCGALITARQKERLESFLAMAEADRIETAATGEIDARAAPGGFFVKPTLPTRVPDQHALAREELFGPVLVAIPFDDEMTR